MTKSRLLIILFIIFVTLVTRLYQLGSIPGGLSWDEAAVAYNGWSVWTIHRDEWLNVMPISFKSFGDYKAPFAIYLNGLSTIVFGFETWAIRLPYALAGITSVAIFLLVGLRLARLGWWSEQSALFGSFLFAILPWHIHFSRIGFESGISLSLILLGVAFFSAASTAPLRKISTYIQAVLMSVSALAFSASLYAYHSAKIFLPVFLLLLIFRFWKTIRANVKMVALFFVILIVASLPLGLDTVFGMGGKRSDVLLPFTELNLLDISAKIGANVVAHLDPAFLLLGKTDTLRHGDGVFGVVLPGVLLLSLIGFLSPLLQSIRSRRFASENMKHAYLGALAWYGAGMMAGWLSQDAPHANRTLLAIPSVLVFSMIGFDLLMKRSILKSMVGLALIVDVLWFSAYSSHYYGQYAHSSEADFQAGYEEVFAHLNSLESAGALPGTTVFSTKYGQPYIYALLYGRKNAISYHQGALNNFLFVDSVSEGDLSRENALIISTDVDRLSKPADTIIYSKNGQSRFYLYNSEN